MPRESRNDAGNWFSNRSSFIKGLTARKKDLIIFEWLQQMALFPQNMIQVYCKNNRWWYRRCRDTRTRYHNRMRDTIQNISKNGSWYGTSMRTYITQRTVVDSKLDQCVIKEPDKNNDCEEQQGISFINVNCKCVQVHVPSFHISLHTDMTSEWKKMKKYHFLAKKKKI